MLYDLKTFSKKRKRVVPKEFFFSFLLFLLLTFNLLNPPPLWKKEILKYPTNPQLHLKLAKIYLEKNDLEKAKKEATLALSFDPNYQEAKNLLALIKDREKEPEKIKEEIKKWEKVLEEQPNYRDAYFRIALLNWQIYREKEALEAVNKALEIDPNFAPAKKLKKILSQ